MLPVKGERQHEDCQGRIVSPLTENAGQDEGLWEYSEFGLGYVEFKTSVGHLSGDLQQVGIHKHSTYLNSTLLLLSEKEKMKMESVHSPLVSFHSTSFSDWPGVILFFSRALPPPHRSCPSPFHPSLPADSSPMKSKSLAFSSEITFQPWLALSK
jgi:hypothetical protein